MEAALSGQTAVEIANYVLNNPLDKLNTPIFLFGTFLSYLH